MAIERNLSAHALFQNVAFFRLHEDRDGGRDVFTLLHFGETHKWRWIGNCYSMNSFDKPLHDLRLCTASQTLS